MINKIAWNPVVVVDEQIVIGENAVFDCDGEKNIVYFVERLRKTRSFPEDPDKCLCNYIHLFVHFEFLFSFFARALWINTGNRQTALFYTRYT